MESPSLSIRGLARRLLAVEAAIRSASGAREHAGVRVCEKLRISLIRVAGTDGFASLMRRTLALARAEAPVVERITVKPDCSMVGLEELANDSREGATEAATAITAQLLGLLVTFIGEPLTLQVVRDAWPDTDLGKVDD